MQKNGYFQALISRIVKRNGLHRLLRDGEPRFQELGRALHRVNAETEEEFLTTGGYLQDFSSRAQAISEASAATAGMIGGPELHAAIAKLTHIFQQTQLLEGECEKGTDILSDILPILDRIQSSIKGFMKIVKTLAVLGNVIRVESARLGSMGTGFAALAREINQLGGEIEDKYSNIFTKSQSVSFSLNYSLANVLNIKANQKDHLQIIIDKTMLSLASLTEKHNLSSATTKNISDNYQNVSRKISDIVISLQFHDITRQQIEHVEKALDNIVSIFQEHFQKNGRQQQVLMLAGHICKIQEGQLTIARDKLTQAVGSIIDNLASIARDIMGISQQVQELAGDASREGSSFLAEMEDFLAAVTEALNLYGAARKDLTALMQAVVPAIDDMSNFLLDIERIEIAIERIALNACVQAAHLGDQGAALGVLAEATQNLVGETRQQTRAVSGHLKSINAAARQLSLDRGVDEDQAEVDVAALVTDLGSVLKTLASLNENVISGLTQVDHQGKSLSADLTKAGGEITVHEYAREALDQVIGGLGELAEQFQTHLPDKCELTVLGAEGLESLKAQYTMVDERKVHEQILITAPTSATAELLALDHAEGERNAVREKDEAADLGDNVELF
ncbi:MAG: hypothetical protein ACOZF2_11855 [Thermodesulfobacteriota bacterium]